MMINLVNIKHNILFIKPYMAAKQGNIGHRSLYALS